MSNAQLAFIFPGQGSQKIGMLAAMAAQHAVVQDTFAEASEALGYDMWQLIQQGEQQEINLTEKTQPILLTSSVALWRAWLQEGGIKPALMAGHSLGEFSALVCSGAIQFADAVKLVQMRGQFMQTAVPVGEGAMAAIIGLDDEVINQVCNATEGVVEAVNYNSPGQVVIAGTVAAVDAAIEALKSEGAKKAMPLPVSAPFHTSLMQPAGDKLEEVIAGLAFAAPEIPVVHNVHAETLAEPEAIKQILVKQIHSPVRWVDCVKYMVAQGVTQAVECGPGKVLTGLTRRIDKRVSGYAIEEPDALLAAIDSVVA
jgi:[acyl-carrier-protein] S-malonyltransferase